MKLFVFQNRKTTWHPSASADAQITPWRPILLRKNAGTSIVGNRNCTTRARRTMLISLTVRSFSEARYSAVITIPKVRKSDPFDAASHRPGDKARSERSADADDQPSAAMMAATAHAQKTIKFHR